MMQYLIWGVMMHTFRHKTRKWYFTFGIPAILIIQLAVAWAAGVLRWKRGLWRMRAKED